MVASNEQDDTAEEVEAPIHEALSVPRVGPAVLNGGRPLTKLSDPCQTHLAGGRRRGGPSTRQPLPTGDSRGCLQRRPRAAPKAPARPVDTGANQRQQGGLGSIIEGEETDDDEETAAAVVVQPSAATTTPSITTRSPLTLPAAHRGVRPQPMSMHALAAVASHTGHLGPEALPTKIGSYSGKSAASTAAPSDHRREKEEVALRYAQFLPSLALSTVAMGLCGIGWLMYDHSAVLQVLQWAHRLRRSWRSQAAFTSILTASTVCMLPSSPVEIAGGAIFGFSPGLMLCIVGKQLGNAIAFQLARSLSRDVVHKHVMPNVRFLRDAEKMATAAPWKTSFCVRAAPIPLVVKNYGLAVLGVPFTHAMTASLVCGPLYSVKNVWIGSTAISIAEVLNGQTTGPAARIAAGTAAMGTLGALLSFGSLAVLHSQTLQGCIEDADGDDEQDAQGNPVS
mmetsp:Transcript_70685/g.132289  ORF Transcript_70685/g.132289 Transcript_70685/m.132289 type:complete len:452 (-) Transcript_70685:52-1407(-)